MKLKVNRIETFFKKMQPTHFFLVYSLSFSLLTMNLATKKKKKIPQLSQG